MPQNKYDVIPTQEEANWLLVSMHAAEDINDYLNVFPSQYEAIGCSATLIWSGSKGNNVPVELFGERKTGIVLHPALIKVPQADLLAYQSGGRVVEETLKIDSYKNFGKEKNTSKYPYKAGYYRRFSDDEWFCTNLARNEHNADTKFSAYHPKGSADVFAKNIWRKYHKSHNRYCENGIMRLNEAIVFQKNKNPVAGLIITEAPDVATASQLAMMMKANKSLNLYFYDSSSPEHIVRYVDNATAVMLLETPMDFNFVFNTAQPFKGFAPCGVEALADNIMDDEDEDHHIIKPALSAVQAKLLALDWTNDVDVITWLESSVKICEKFAENKTAQQQLKDLTIQCLRIKTLLPLKSAILAIQEKGGAMEKEGAAQPHGDRLKDGKDFQTLGNKLLKKFSDFIERTTIDEQEFYDTFTEILTSDPIVLNIHHSKIWKPLLSHIMNALVCLTFLGTVFQLAYYAKHKHLLFSPGPTEREEIINSVRNEINSV